MGRTNQVLTGGSIFSTSPQTTAMKIVLALLVLCLFQFSLAEQEDVDTAETNLVLERDAREAGKKCENGDRKCKRRQKKKKSRKNAKKGGKKKVWKRKKTETGEWKENWKAAESKKERKESKKAKFNEEAGKGKVFIWRTYEWKKHNRGHMFRGPGCKDEEVQQGPSRVQALQESPDLGKADEEQEDQRSFHVR